MTRYFQNIILVVVGLLALASCRHDTPDSPDTVRRTVLVYMVANNNLGQGGYDANDLSEMRRAIAGGALDKGGRLLVYRNGADGTNTLFELTSNGRETVHRDYGELAAGTSVTAEHMSRVIDDARAIGGATTPMAMVFWSHGTGWMDDSPIAAGAPQLFSFGNDARRKMHLSQLAKALKGKNLEWIYFDCCHMATIEVLYELRHCARRFVGSATELPIDGMPYDLNLPLFFAEGEVDLIGAARNTYEHYAPDAYSFCTMCVVESDRLDALAAATREVLAAAGSAAPAADYTGMPLMRKNYSNNYTCTIYDMAHYIDALLPADATERRRWHDAFDAAVSYSAHTPECIGLDLTGFCGLGCNIVRTADDADTFGYGNYAWWADVVSPYVKQ